MGKQILNGVVYGNQVPYRELTKAEYDALPNSKYTDGIMYYIRDVSSPDDFGTPHKYSTDEQIVGTWIDGKPIYEKSIHTSITNATQWIATGITNVARVIRSEGSMINNNNDLITLPSSDSSSIAGINTFVISNNELNCLFRTSNADVRGDLILTLQYTKTTD